MNVVNRAEFEASRLIFCVDLSGEENDGNVGCAGIRLQADAHLISIHFRHHDVQKYQVRLGENFCKIQRLGAARRDLDDVRVFQSMVRNLYVGRRVVNNEDDLFVRNGLH